MFISMKKLMSRYENYMTAKGREDARQILLTKSPRALEDMGIDPHLLNQGLDAWPWRNGEVAAKPARIVAVSKASEERRAIRELRSMNNAELADLGISRGSIVDAVKNGRPADRTDSTEQHAA